MTKSRMVSILLYLVDLVLILNTLFNYICYDSSNIPRLITTLFDKLNSCSFNRPYVVKYYKKLVDRLLTDPQYGESISNTIKEKPDKYSCLIALEVEKHKNSSNKLFSDINIWRNVPESKEQTELIYRNTGNILQVDKFSTINEIPNFDKKFPLIPDKAVIISNSDGINIEEIRQLVKGNTAYAEENKNLK